MNGKEINNMFISRKDYEKLHDRAKLVDELEKECNRLANLISLEVKDCKVGVWCKECKYFAEDESVVRESIYPIFGDVSTSYVKECGGKVQYCKKHIYEICPEFMKNFNL